MSYPRWIAHRGAGHQAPENTMAAFRAGFESGFRMFECDAKLSSDGVVYLLHDDTLNRTTNAAGPAHLLAWNELKLLDAGSWHSKSFEGEAIPTLEEIIRFCLDKQCQLNIEIKPSLGFETQTGESVAREVQRLWSGQPPLLSSFKREALRGAQSIAPEIPRGLLMDALAPDWHEATKDMQCSALICNEKLYNTRLLDEIKARDLCALAYTVNNQTRAQMLMEMGIDAIITDCMEFASL
ncbi:glycerophosphodiester phosphodiesterase [Zwartia vadi]|uniref:glycerophosphodiester phosphodiesterase n=1 Tax=Zwartia vadi TaxID=3058168 RepID=UPI0025B49B37|nr:glycerophosphodiester phosphodiesterase [Zwartia vadi]MDN3986738.1 glycerophosphodiester phosphodiesterase [Zwartia vadi]